MVRTENPVRNVLNYASDCFLRHLPIVYVLTVVGRTNDSITPIAPDRPISQLVKSPVCQLTLTPGDAATPFLYSFSSLRVMSSNCCFESTASVCTAPPLPTCALNTYWVFVWA